MDPGRTAVLILLTTLAAWAGISAYLIWEEGSQTPYDYEYLECIPASTFGDFDAISGVGEPVTVGGVDYIRMADVGDLTFVKGSEHVTYKVGPANLDLILLSGQSNSMRFTHPDYWTYDAPVGPGVAFYMGTPDPTTSENGGIIRESTVSRAELCDFIDDDGNVRLSQMYPMLYYDYIRETGHRVLTMSTGMGGVPISYWDVGQRADKLMHAAFDKLDSMVKDSKGKIAVHDVGVLWVQGEGATDVADYVQRFEALIDRLQDGTYGGHRFDIVTASLPRASMRPIDDMIPAALAQIQVAEEDPTFSIASELAYRVTAAQMRDGVHFTQEYYSWIGEAFARELAIRLGLTPVMETVVLASPVTGETLPSHVEAYGTSGKAFDVDVEWPEDATAPGVYEGELLAPARMVIRPGLTAEGTIPDTTEEE